MKLLRIALTTLCLSAGLPFVGTAARPERYPEIRVKTPEVKMRLKRMNRKHPRLFVGREGFAALDRVRRFPEGRALAEKVISDAETLLKEPVKTRQMEGRRLLSVSRAVLFRVTTLSAASHLTNRGKFAKRAIREMLAAAEFSDWNPSHFLDVGEMTLALAIGYDWLYDQLTEKERETIAEAIIEKGLKPSFRGKQFWISGTNNWNQVCHAGMAAGALAVYREEPDLAEQVIERAVNNLPKAMKSGYYPNGAYPEGPMYWGYGTDFNVVLLAMFDAAFGQDFGLSALPGFDKTGDFILATCGPTGKLFCYADCTERGSISFATIWLAHKFRRPGWMGPQQQQALREHCERRPARLGGDGNRLLPLALLYLDPPAETTRQPLSYFSGEGAAVPIATFRSGWDPDASYLAIKGGSPSASHGHMDAGSFIFESDQVRWAVDLGMENYTRVEALKDKLNINLWDGAQKGGRWKLFRLGPQSHNILRIGNELQLVDGNAEISDVSASGAVMDLTPLYKNSASSVIRSFQLLPSREVVIEDRLAGIKKGAMVRWQMATPSRIKIRGNRVILRQGDKTLELTASDGRWSEVDAATLLTPELDAPVRDLRMLYLDLPPVRNGATGVRVVLTPGSVPAGKRMNPAETSPHL